MGILNTLSKNPTLIALGALAVGLFIFRDKISGFFSDITGGAETAAELGETVGVLNENLLSNLKGIQDILSGDIFKDFEFPTFELPTFEFPTFELPTFELPTFEFPDFQKMFDDFIAGIGGGNGGGGNGGGGDFTDTGMAAARARQEDELAKADIPIRDIEDDLAGLTPAQRFAFIERGVIPTGFQVVGGVLVQEGGGMLIGGGFDKPEVKSFLLDEPTQKFEGGGISFEGGGIFETPIENLSLSQIIDKFGVTASQAANIKAIAADDFGDFDFGTNTGLGIGSVIGTIPQISGGGTNVSDPSFAGLSAEEIALILTGGNISNF